MNAYKEALKRHLSKIKGGGNDEHAQVMMHPNEDPENKMHDEAPEQEGHMVDGKMVADSTAEEELENPSSVISGPPSHGDEQQDIELIKKILGESKLRQKGMEIGAKKHAGAMDHGKLFSKKMKA